jgi:magnesium transporter
MKRTYCIEGGRLKPSSGEGCAESVLVCYSNPTREERQEIASSGIGEHDMASALDPDELGRFEMEDDHAVFIMKTPRNYSTEDDYLFRVTSYGLFQFPGRILMVSPFDEHDILEQRPLAKIKSLRELLLKIVSATVAHFFGHLKVINMISDSLEEKVNSSMENQHLLSMFSVGKSLIYILNGINSNTAVLERMRNQGGKLALTEEERELLDDICIENAQCSKQAEIYAEILTGLTDARGNIVNNNLNILIKRLTIVSVVFMPLNVIAGVGGMSEFTAMTKHVPFWISYPILALAMAGVAAATWFTIRLMSPDARKAMRMRNRKSPLA